jgi:hypothetical protein
MDVSLGPWGEQELRPEEKYEQLITFSNRIGKAPMTTPANPVFPRESNPANAALPKR